MNPTLPQISVVLSKRRGRTPGTLERYPSHEAFLNDFWEKLEQAVTRTRLFPKLEVLTQKLRYRNPRDVNRRLGDAGYNYRTIQKKVRELMSDFLVIDVRFSVRFLPARSGLYCL